MLAETLALRPLRIEPVEDAFELALGDAGPLIRDADLDHAAERLLRTEPDLAARRAEGPGVADQIAQHLHDPPFDPGDHQSRLEFAHLQDRRGLGSRCIVDIGQRAKHRTDLQRHRRRAGNLSIHPRRIGNIRDEAIKPDDILAHDGEQAFSLGRILHPAQSLDGAANRGQRILDLMRDIGGEPLDRIHPAPQRSRGI